MVDLASVDELLERIFLFVVLPSLLSDRPRQPAELDDGARSLLRLRQSSTTFKLLADSARLWKALVAARWPRSNERSQQENDQPRVVYERRFLADIAASEQLDCIVNEPKDRLLHFAELAGTQNEEIDMLSQRAAAMTMTLTEWLESDRCFEGDMPANALAEAFWANEVVSALTRRHIHHRWSRGGGNLTFEEGFTMMSQFRGVSSDSVVSQLDTVADLCRSALVDSSVDVGDGRGIISTLWSALSAQGFGPAQARFYHDLAGAFPDAVLSYHRETLPILLVYVLVAVGARLGIIIEPIGWPGTVMALAIGTHRGFGRRNAEEDGDGEAVTFEEPIYFSPYTESFANRDELSRRLDDMPLPTPLHHLHLEPASSRDMVARCARNLLQGHSEQQYPERWSNSDSLLAMMAALCALHATGSSTGIVASSRFALAILAEHPLDVALLKRIAGTSGQRATTEHAVMSRELQRIFALREADDGQSPTPRYETRPALVRYRIGQVFRHHRYGYTAIITDWDETCTQSDEWMQMMQINSLTSGAQQPFYSSWRTDTGATHYVAQENISPYESMNEALERELRAAVDLPQFGAHFAGYRAHPPQFVPGTTLRAKYPED